MENADIHKELFEKISSFLQKEEAIKVAFFGSYAEGKKAGK
jgi:predicted nucleotidyltransferase